MWLNISRALCALSCTLTRLNIGYFDRFHRLAEEVLRGGFLSFARGQRTRRLSCHDSRNFNGLNIRSVFRLVPTGVQSGGGLCGREPGGPAADHRAARGSSPPRGATGCRASRPPRHPAGREEKILFILLESAKRFCKN